MAHRTAKEKIELVAQAREITGRKVRSLRADGIIPAVLYGKGQDSVSLSVPLKDFERALRSAGASTLVYLKLGETQYPTIIHEIARHPVTGVPLHADFYRVRLDEKIKTNVPVVFTGESPAVRDSGGIFVRNINELEVEALPASLPHEISVDISSLKNFGDQILLKDISVPDAQLTGSGDDVIATVQEPKSEEELAAELAAPTTDVSAVEEIEKEKPAEEEVPAEEAPAAPAAAEEKKE